MTLPRIPPPDPQSPIGAPRFAGLVARDLVAFGLVAALIVAGMAIVKALGWCG